jgi:hypothetical protein
VRGQSISFQRGKSTRTSHLNCLQDPNVHAFLVGDGDDTGALDFLVWSHHRFPNFEHDQYQSEMRAVGNPGICMCDLERVENLQAPEAVHIFRGRNLRDFQFVDR